MDRADAIVDNYNSKFSGLQGPPGLVSTSQELAQNHMRKLYAQLAIKKNADELKKQKATENQLKIEKSWRTSLALSAKNSLLKPLPGKRKSRRNM